MVNTSFKTTLKTYGKRKIINVPISYILIAVFLITPFTNWLIPCVLKTIKGKIRVEL